ASAERPDVAVHEPRVRRAELLRSEAEPVRGAGPEALQEDVRVLDEPEQDLAPALDVERKRALVQVRGVEHDARVLPKRRTPGPRLVAALGMFDLDHVGTEGAEDLRTVGPSQRARHVDDPHSPQPQERRGHARATTRDSRAPMTLAFLNGLIDLLTGSR